MTLKFSLGYLQMYNYIIILYILYTIYNIFQFLYLIEIFNRLLALLYRLMELEYDTTQHPLFINVYDFRVSPISFSCSISKPNSTRLIKIEIDLHRAKVVGLRYQP